MKSTFIFRRPARSNADAFRRADLLDSVAGWSSIFMIFDDSRLLLDCLRLTAENFLNCEVAAFDSPVEAWRAFGRDPKSWRGVITDYHMPQMTGADLIRRIRPAFPELPVVLMSGEAEPGEADIGDDPFTRFVRKPFAW